MPLIPVDPALISTGDAADASTGEISDCPPPPACPDNEAAALVGALDTLAGDDGDPTAIAPGVAVVVALAWLLKRRKKAAPKPPQG